MTDFRRLPKIDLHLHLDGAIRTQTLRELADERGNHLPRPLERHVTVRGRTTLLKFLKCFDVFLPVLRYPEAMERIAYELCEDCASDGVVYFETRYAPLLQESATCSLEESVEAVCRGLRRGRRDFGVENGLILCFLRTVPKQSMRTLRAAFRYGAVGIDIAGDERAPASAHSSAFRKARREGLPITVHCGEAGPAANVREAVTQLGARRIGHGVRAVDDPDLMHRLAASRITIESCLTSNVQTGAVSSLRTHPLRRFMTAGVPVTLNTDDPRISRTTLSREYALAAKTFGLTRTDFQRMNEWAVEASFASRSVRRRISQALLSA